MIVVIDLGYQKRNFTLNNINHKIWEMIHLRANALLIMEPQKK